MYMLHTYTHVSFPFWEKQLLIEINLLIALIPADMCAQRSIAMLHEIFLIVWYVPITM